MKRLNSHSDSSLPDESLLPDESFLKDEPRPTVGPARLASQNGTIRLVTLTHPQDEVTTLRVAETSAPGWQNRRAEFAAFKTQKYEYLAEIARGGMGRVVLVRDRHLRRRMAMKLLNVPNSKKADFYTARFLAEAQTVGQLEHPNIVPIHDLGVLPDGRRFFTMKLVKGDTLSAVFRRLAAGHEATVKKYTLPRLLAIFQQIANGLGFAHTRGVIHRDLKPDNVMLGEFGEVMIMDWGLAKLKQLKQGPPLLAPTTDAAAEAENQGLAAGIDSLAIEGTVGGTIIGTPGYMSPEQARGEIDRIDERSDIYALGAMLYEMLAESRPYNQPDARARIYAAAACETVEAPAARLRKRDPARAARMPREVSAIAMKALSPNPADRYASAQDFSDDIQRYLEGRSVHACPDTSWQRLVKWTRRHRLLVGVAAAGFCLLTITGVGVQSLTRYSMTSHKAGKVRDRW